jgi:hypothetical protein
VSLLIWNRRIKAGAIAKCTFMIQTTTAFVLSIAVNSVNEAILWSSAHLMRRREDITDSSPHGA